MKIIIFCLKQFFFIIVTMKLLSSRYILQLYRRTSYNNFALLSFSKHWLLTHCYTYSKTREICNVYLNNSAVRSYLDKLISDKYSDTMSKPKVARLISTIRSLKADLQSLGEFDTGHYIIVLFSIYL